MLNKKILGCIIVGTVLSATVGIGISNTNTNHINTNTNNHILLAAPVQNNGNQATVVHTNNAPLVLYSGASNTSAIKSYLSVGEMLTINNFENGFYDVTVHETGATGYISGYNLQKIVSGVNQQYTNVNKKGKIINVSSSVHLRSNATMNSSILLNFENNTNINILGKQGNWYKVSANGSTGYIYQLYVGVLNENISSNSVNTATKPNVTKPSVKPTTNNNVTNKSNTSTPVTKPSAKPNTNSNVTKPNTNTPVTKPSTNTPVTKPNNNSNTNVASGSIVPGNNIISSAKSYAVPANIVSQMLRGNYKNGKKQIFLTFDDGPSATNTPKVLNVLKQYGVHGTFFIVGSELQSKTDQNLLKEEIYSGNAIANHSFSHDYAKLYPHNSVNVSAFMNEFNKTEGLMQNVLGSNFDTKVVRMPGGYMSRQYYHDKNLPALDSVFKKDGITSIDWNAETGDATGKPYTPSQLVQNAIKETKGYNHIVLLMHDVKGNTAAALPQLIQYYKSQGYSFDVISNAN